MGDGRWKKYTSQQCAKFHNRLYEVDCELKNGSDETAPRNVLLGAFSEQIKNNIHHKE